MKELTSWYKLEGHQVVPAKDYEDLRMARDKSVVGKTQIGKVLVSTVFLSLDHSLGHGEKPVVFETMIFGGKLDQYQERYCTWDEAEKGHKEVCRLVNRKWHLKFLDRLFGRI